MRLILAGFVASLSCLALDVWALPSGEGERLVREHCSSCHRPEILNRAQGYDSADEWRQLMASMLELDEPRADIIARYLTEHFKSKPELYPTLVPGPVNIEIEEWMVPTLGQRSRDPIEAPDGSIWWTGMWASRVGRFDPLTGEFKEYPLPVTARPHSIVPDEEGAIWYLGNSNGTVGKLNPLTGEIREYETGLADPHTGVFHPNGYFYFTAQHTGAVARLDPVTGEVLSVNTCPRPYGIKVGPDGYLYVAFNGENAIGQVNPDTLEVNYFVIPHEDSRIRRLDIASDGTNLWCLPGGWTKGDAITVLNAEDGTKVRTVATQANAKNRHSGAKGILWVRGKLYVFEGMAGKLHELDSATGDIKWSGTIGTNWCSGMAFDGTYLITANRTRNGKELFFITPPEGEAPPKIARRVKVNYWLRSLAADAAKGDGILYAMEQPVRGFDKHHKPVSIWPRKTVIYQLIRKKG